MMFLRFDYRSFDRDNTIVSAQLELDELTKRANIENLVTIVKGMTKESLSPEEYELSNVVKYSMGPSKHDEINVIEEYEVRHGKLFKVYQSEEQKYDAPKQNTAGLKSIW